MSGAASPAGMLRAAREADWRRLETLLDRLERRSPAALPDEDLLALPGLYRSTLSSLSVARATVLDQNLVDYLEGLSTRAYFVVYGTRVAWRARLARFFAADWPATARALWREVAAAALLVLAGAVAGFLLTRASPAWFGAFVPEGLAGGRDPQATTQTLRAALHGEHEGAGLSLFASYLFNHNAQVAILAFALGFAFCVPTAMLLVYSGGTVGAFLALYAARGLGTELGGWLMVHGVTELLAVTLAGAGGLHIGTAIAAPGPLTRVEAAARAGRRAATLLAGAVVMLVVAAVLEGVVRQVVDDTASRYAIAGGTAVFWLAYLTRAGRFREGSR